MKSVVMKVVVTAYNVFSLISAAGIAPFFIIMGLIADVYNSYISVSIFLSYAPFLFGEKVRFIYYKATLRKLGSNTVFKFGSFCNYRDTAIGDNVLIGYFTSLGMVSIGDNVLFGGYVNVLSGRHQHSYFDTNKTIMSQPAEGRRAIAIGSDVWIGSNAVILNDIGTRCVIGAGSVVINKVDDHTLVAGNPAKMIKTI